MIAEQRGFSHGNPTTFFIQHVYAARINTLIRLAARITALEKITCSDEALS